LAGSPHRSEAAIGSPSAGSKFTSVAAATSARRETNGEKTMAEHKAKIELEMARNGAETTGILNSLVAQSSGLAERATSGVFGIAQEVRSEITQRVHGTIDWFEGGELAINRVVRGASGRIDKIAGEAIEAVETVCLELVRAARETGNGLAEVASRATLTLVKPTSHVRAA
jgi:hypothetical protein